MELTDLSRSMISKGTKRLCELKLLSVKQEGRGRKNRYFVNAYMTGSWGKIPYRPVAGGFSGRLTLLYELSCKRASDLNALKLYLLLCAHRNGGSPYAMIGYEKIHDATGIPKRKIRQAMSILIEHGLIFKWSGRKFSATKRTIPTAIRFSVFPPLVRLSRTRSHNTRFC